MHAGCPTVPAMVVPCCPSLQVMRYLVEHGIPYLIDDLIGSLLDKRPEDPHAIINLIHEAIAAKVL